MHQDWRVDQSAMRLEVGPVSRCQQKGFVIVKDVPADRMRTKLDSAVSQVPKVHLETARQTGDQRTTEKSGGLLVALGKGPHQKRPQVQRVVWLHHRVHVIENALGELVRSSGIGECPLRMANRGGHLLEAWSARKTSKCRWP
ncbi:unnamed protein product [Linum trigynum]|uniref:Uncharacterized protein n=1 Tax=Linum trigynum TaxID=586398 RepID=A0AAV2FUV9_9ROSI